MARRRTDARVAAEARAELGVAVGVFFVEDGDAVRAGWIRDRADGRDRDISLLRLVALQREPRARADVPREAVGDRRVATAEVGSSCRGRAHEREQGELHDEQVLALRVWCCNEHKAQGQHWRRQWTNSDIIDQQETQNRFVLLSSTSCCFEFVLLAVVVLNRAGLCP